MQVGVWLALWQGCVAEAALVPGGSWGGAAQRESGNYYTLNRYYPANLGRWLSPDPSNLGVDFWLPQTWNRYSYVLNNPLTLVDRNGIWPTYIHNEIIDEAFPGMSAQDLKLLKDASYNMDYGPGQQSAALAFEHGMSNGVTGQPASEAERWADEFISRSERLAQRIQAKWIASGHTGIAPAALTAFGNALHTITDRLSPAHAGYQPWYGQSKLSPSAWWHWVRESDISQGQKDAAVSAARQAFWETFALEYAQFDILRLQLGQPQRAEVTSRVCPNGRFDPSGNFVCQ
jgi:RHS repeat-associated protein